MQHRQLDSTMTARFALRCLSLVTLLALVQPIFSEIAMAQAVAPQWYKDAASNCSFIAPTSLGSGTIHWIGACTDGKAVGAGMLRRRDGGRAGAAFYGEMEAGVPKLGVVDGAAGYRVGHYVGGDIGEANLQLQSRLDGFNAAIRAARAVSAHYAEIKNGASAEYYEDIAKTLEAQME
jgi:hypothetical protein